MEIMFANTDESWSKLKLQSTHDYKNLYQTPFWNFVYLVLLPMLALMFELISSPDYSHIPGGTLLTLGGGRGGGLGGLGTKGFASGACVVYTELSIFALEEVDAWTGIGGGGLWGRGGILMTCGDKMG